MTSCFRSAALVSFCRLVGWGLLLTAGSQPQMVFAQNDFRLMAAADDPTTPPPPPAESLSAGAATEPESVFTPGPTWMGLSLPPASPQPQVTDSSAESWGWYVVPDGLMYKSYAAGEREPRLATSFLQENGGEVLWDSTLGGKVGILRYGTAGAWQPQGFQLDVEGAAFVRLLPEQDRDVNATDYRAGTALTYREGPFQTKFGYYHISSHLGDEFLLKRPGYDRLNYSRDALVLGVGYFPSDMWRLYFEVGWAVIFTSGGAEPWEVQTGFEYGTQGPTGLRGAPYFALNVHLREEVDWGGNITMISGWMWRGFHADHTFRVGFEYFNGKNAQFSLLQDNQQLFGMGIRYDY